MTGMRSVNATCVYGLRTDDRGRRRGKWGLVICLALLPMLGGCLQAPQSLEQAAAGRQLATESPQVQALATAAGEGNVEEVRRLMQDEGVNPDTVFWGRGNGYPLLAWPIYRGSPEGLRAMLENGADPNVAKPRPRKPRRSQRNEPNAMVWAAEQDDPVYLELLLDHGGDPDTRNANRETLMFHAYINRDKWQNVQLLVNHGADVNALAGMGGTILHSYASMGRFERAYWLMTHGADATRAHSFEKPVNRNDSLTVQAIFWYPASGENAKWQQRCQRILLAQGIERPPMPEHFRRHRQALGHPYEESEIPLPDMEGEE